MRVLIDTHIAIWAITDDPQLSPKAREIIENPNNEIYYSVATVWEVTIKHHIHPETFLYDGRYLAEACDDNGYIPILIKLPHVYTVDTLKRPDESPRHKDPFDRLLLAQAKAEGMKFLTHDSKIPYYNEDCIISV